MTAYLAFYDLANSHLAFYSRPPRCITLHFSMLKSITYVKVIIRNLQATMLSKCRCMLKQSELTEDVVTGASTVETSPFSSSTSPEVDADVNNNNGTITMGKSQSINIWGGFKMHTSSVELFS